MTNDAFFTAFCAACRAFIPKDRREFGLCGYCLESVGDLAINDRYDTVIRLPSQRFLPCLSFYKYGGIIRVLIHRAKIGRHRASDEVLRRLFFARATRLLSRISVTSDLQIVPVAASLWSRIRGRWDLAGAFAESLTQASGASLVLPPRRLAMNWQKESYRMERISRLERCDPMSLKTPSAIYVDDVVTTGHSLSALAEAHSGDGYDMALVLASGQGFQRFKTRS